MTIDIKKFRFRNFQMYKDARKFSVFMKKLSKIKFPKDEQFNLLSQLWRAFDSVVLNIAEGSDRGTDKDFAHFLNNAHTSLNEVVACTDVALDSAYLTESDHSQCLHEAEKVANQLTAFRKSLLSRPSK